jgi:predicted ester cyclase
MTIPSVADLIRREITPDEHDRIRELWKSHSIAEDKRDIPGLLATLTPNCVYELPQTGHQWYGHTGAEQFYRQLLTAFPDVHFDLTNIVIGPQGIWEEARVLGTHSGDWLGQPATGARTEFTVLIFFPWDPARQKFRGERVYAFGGGVNEILGKAAADRNRS